MVLNIFFLLGEKNWVHFFFSFINDLLAQVDNKKNEIAYHLKL